MTDKRSKGSSLVVRITPTMNQRLRLAYKEYESWCAENWTPPVTFSSFVPEFCLTGWKMTLDNSKAKKRISATT